MATLTFDRPLVLTEQGVDNLDEKVGKKFAEARRHQALSRHRKNGG